MLMMCSAADATSHLFFAYLRSLSPDSVRGINGVSALPISLQTLVQETRYPPETAPYEATSKVVMVVDSVSPTPFALLRRAKHFEYRDDDQTLQQFSDFEDPVQALTDECRRVLKSISSANQSAISTTKASTSLGDSSWSRFEDMGFAGLGDYDDDDEPDSALGRKREVPKGLRSAPQTKSNDLGRPTTPSWADFLSSGFVDDANDSGPAPLLLPPDKILPPINLDFDKRGQSSQSHKRVPDRNLEPGELASINALDLDDAFWWVWITSLAGEETAARKSAFGRCALIETSISGGTWLVIEEMVKGAASEPEVGAYIAEKKGRFTFGKRNKMTRTKSMGRKTLPPKVEPFPRSNQPSPMSKTSIGPDQHARIQAAAAALQQKHREQDSAEAPVKTSPRRARQGDAVSTKTNSVFTLQPVIMTEAAPAMKWANTYDKKTIRAAYLGNNFAGKGSTTDLDAGVDTNGSITPMPPSIAPQPPKEAAKPDSGVPNQEARDTERDLPILPIGTQSEAPRAPMGPPPPIPAAPLPVEPATQPLNHVAADAADVPLPIAAPMESTERTFSESEPLEPTRTITQDQPDEVSPVSPPENKKDRKKLKKQQGGGLKGLFGKKKSPATPAPAPPADSTAVAAARAAYQGPQSRPNYNASNSLTRRLSGMGRKKNLPASTQINATGSDNDALPAPAAPFKDQYDSQASLSRIDSNEERRADNEFQTFDQGPQTFNQGHPFNPSNQTFDQGPVDQPAFVPVSPDRPSFVPESPTVSRPSTTEHRGPHYDPPIGRGEYEPSVSSEAETPVEPVQDRWAQIRKNAAERAERSTEQRMSEDKGADDDGEDDGDQESRFLVSFPDEDIADQLPAIESRVARIKARVAELTGNMGNEPKAAAT